MTTYVFTRPENRQSAERLGYPLSLGNARGIPAGSNVIRWGVSSPEDQRGWGTVLNKSAVLQISIDKVAALQALARVVTTPKLFLEGQTLPAGKYVVRPYVHAQGSDFQLVTSSGNRRVAEGHHATEFIPDTNEYRVWFVRGEYLVARRVPLEAQGNTPTDPCRSTWGYEAVQTCFPKLKAEMDKARMAIPLDFGAADVLWKEDYDANGGRWVFLEINSAPSLDTPRVLRHFQTHLQAIVGPPVAQEVVTQPPPRESAPNRRLSSPVGATPTADVSWEERYREQVRAQVAARKLQIQQEEWSRA